MPEPTFTKGQRVYHRQLKRFGTYVEKSWTSGESIVDFDTDDDYEDCLRITTAQLVPAEEAGR
ncbi:hypothetical protein Ade02nite_21160 [Paractinoplanes deccanensis]|uniref:Uncharacterized protein n=1 Tax=Paractinoplanes deccanensis TaxID=113561 RepID=A0ABQ3Y0I4_9ACTN|nr:hypothetical protein [Actinoplanes deccanensis]GID73475.1 hypothetical protein Ade02nite_21160 [Actinoplanes deccanensis]